ncbi:MAG: hypothetical protein WDN69_10005 [Aliidongia sp.]
MGAGRLGRGAQGERDRFVARGAGALLQPGLDRRGDFGAQGFEQLGIALVEMPDQPLEQPPGGIGSGCRTRHGAALAAFGRQEQVSQHGEILDCGAPP